MHGKLYKLSRKSILLETDELAVTFPFIGVNKTCEQSMEQYREDRSSTQIIIHSHCPPPSTLCASIICDGLANHF